MSLVPPVRTPALAPRAQIRKPRPRRHRLGNAGWAANEIQDLRRQLTAANQALADAEHENDVLRRRLQQARRARGLAPAKAELPRAASQRAPRATPQHAPRAERAVGGAVASETGHPSPRQDGKP